MRQRRCARIYPFAGGSNRNRLSVRQNGARPPRKAASEKGESGPTRLQLEVGATRRSRRYTAHFSFGATKEDRGFSKLSVPVMFLPPFLVPIHKCFHVQILLSNRRRSGAAACL